MLTEEGEIFTWGNGCSGRLGHQSARCVLPCGCLLVGVTVSDRHLPAFLSTGLSKCMFGLFLRAHQMLVHTLEVAQHTVVLVVMQSLSRTLMQNSNEILPRQVQLSSHATVHPVGVAAGECHTCIFRSFSTAFSNLPSRRSRRLFLNHRLYSRCEKPTEGDFHWLRGIKNCSRHE